MKIRAKISLSMIGLYLATALATAAAVITVTLRTVENQSRNTLKAVTETLDESYSAFIQYNTDFLRGYTDTEAFIGAASGGPDSAAARETRRMMKDLLEASPQIRDIFISRGDTILFSGSRLLTRPPRGETALVPEEGGGTLLVIQRRLENGDASLGFVLSLDLFSRRAESMKIAARAALFIIDRGARRMIMHTEPSHLASPSDAQIGFLSRVGDITTGMHGYRVGREDKVAYLLVDGERDLIFGVSLFRSDLLQDMYRAYRLLVFISAAAAAAFVAVALLIAGGIARPVLHLAEAARQVAARRYTVRVHLKSRDEMELLGTTFNQMAEDIQAFTGNLEELVAQRTTELEQKVRQIEELSVTDHLTGIFNRKRFAEELAAETARAIRYEGTFAVIMFDIDHFKEINDGYGHAVGDEVLVELSGLVRRNIRSADLFARWGGEEFMVLLPHTDLGGAASMAEKLRESVETHSFPGVARVTCSFGVAGFTEIDDATVILKRVDDALYEAKETGRNRVVVA